LKTLGRCSLAEKPEETTKTDVMEFQVSAVQLEKIYFGLELQDKNSSTANLPCSR
jgi:hypothetical protein